MKENPKTVGDWLKNLTVWQWFGLVYLVLFTLFLIFVILANVFFGVSDVFSWN